MKRLSLLLFTLIAFISAQAQLVQTIRGKVVDKESQYPLIGVTVRVLTDTSDGVKGTITDTEGRFILEDVKVGRHTLEFRYVGYQTRVMNNVQVSSAKQVILNIQMEESVAMSKEAVVKAESNRAGPQNEMAVISARTFTVEETDQFAGSRGDPSRMASNFAGVQGANDSRNDIVIRGNTPAGVLWRVNGVDIPNPNHFAIPGTAGGPVNIINNKMLANSDFYTGAFPAEFGNAISGVFDLQLRPGNNQEYEHSFQFGFLGSEIYSEGPINKEKGSSYLVGGRYSTLALFGALNIPIGTEAIPNYMDGGFKLNFPLKNNSSISFWGLGGYSTIDIKISDQDPSERNIYGDNDRDQYFTSYMGVFGVTYNKSFNKNTYFKVSASTSNQTVTADHDYLYYNADRTHLDSMSKMLQYRFGQTDFNTHAFVNHKFNSHWTMKAGLLVDYYTFSFNDSARLVSKDSAGMNYLLPWTTRWNSKENAVMLRPYAQFKYKPNARWTFNFGLHSQYFSLSNSLSPIEPRGGVRYELNSKNALTAGFGLHSQMQSPYLYFYRLSGDKEPHNKGMDFTKSWHSVLGWQHALGKRTRLKVETYHQYLYNIPVSDTATSFSLINTGSGFERFFAGQLVNKGIGRNMGLEVTVEHFFSKSFFFLITGSVFDAKYQGSDGIWRNTDFNGGYTLSAVITKEFKIKENSGLQVGTNITTVGGRYYSPADTAESNKVSELVGIDSEKNTLQMKPYFRMDLQVSYKWNPPKVPHIFAIDIVNVLNTQNVLSLTYAPDGAGNNIRFDYQLSLLPLFYYRLDF